MENNEKILMSAIDSYKVDVPLSEEYTGNSKTYIPWGKDNRFPTTLRYFYKGSATLKSIIDGTVNYICGSDIKVSPEIDKWKDEVNRRGDTLNDLLFSIATDFMLYNGFAIQVIYTKLGTVAELYALDFSKCRTDEYGRHIYYFKKGCTQYSTKYEVYDAFDRDHIDPKKPTQIFYFKGGARTVYPSPRYEGALTDIATEIEASKYSLNSIANGLSARYIITLPNASNLTDEQKGAIEEGIKSKFCGTDNPSSFLLYYSDDAANGLKVDAITSDEQNEKFVTLKKAARENIFTAFSAIPSLFGLMTESKGFSKEEFLQAFELYNKTQVIPAQKKIIRCLDKIFGVKDCISITSFSLDPIE